MAGGKIRTGSTRSRRSAARALARLAVPSPHRGAVAAWRAAVLLGLLILPLIAPALPSTTAAPISGAATRIGEGVYSVYATREGLVGGYTSSGHKIVTHDYFVSLPSCTTTSCPRGATRGFMTNCGTKCYVKVVNPRTNACRVEPILDTGPWFRVDDWWNPTAQRYLNSLASNPNDLAQGYTGSEAARNGLNVGYGIGPNGFGYDDTGTTPPRPMREVGNRAAIDLADGTWYDLRLASDGTGANVTVHMLWQTGADPAAQAQACGHSLNQKPSGNPPGVPNPSFRGFRAHITNSFDNPSTGTAPGAHDTDPGTTWFSGRDYRSRASLTVDLGDTYDISGVKWKFHTLGLADHFTVSVQNAAGGTRTLGLFGNAPYAQSFYGVATSDPVHARFITFAFSNVNNDVSLGSISELEVWARSLASPPSSGTSSGALNPLFPGFRSGIVYSGDSPYTGSSFASYDNNLNTTWFSGRDYQPRASLTVDLGATYDLTGIRWKFHTLGLADQFSVTVVNETGGTRGIGVFGNAAYPQAFYGVGINDPVYARYVVFSFTNIGNDASLGSISELEVWARRYISPSANISSASVDPTPTSSPTVTPTPSPSVTPTATPTKEPTATPSPTEEPTATPTVEPTATQTEMPVAATPEAETPEQAATPGTEPEPNASPEPSIESEAGTGATPAPTDAVQGHDPGIEPPATEPVETPEPPDDPATPTPTVSTGDDAGSIGAVGYIAFTGGGDVFCRSLPAADAEPIALLPEGTEVVLNGEPIDGWQPVVCADQPGYVSAELMTMDEPASTQPVDPPTEETEPTEAPEGDAPDAIVEVEPTAVPTAAAEPAERQLTIVAQADTSVTERDPDSPQWPGAASSLPVGGDAGAIAVLSFQIDDVVDGEIVAARLVLTGAGDAAGPGGELIVVPGVVFDETGATWNNVAGVGGWSAGWVDWVQPGVETAVDVTGAVTGDGSITFVIAGTPDQGVAIASHDGGAPAYLVLTIEEVGGP